MRWLRSGRWFDRARRRPVLSAFTKAHLPTLERIRLKFYFSWLRRPVLVFCIICFGTGPRLIFLYYLFWHRPALELFVLFVWAFFVFVVGPLGASIGAPQGICSLQM